MRSYITALQHYAIFSGRMSRSEFLLFQLVTNIIQLLLIAGFWLFLDSRFLVAWLLYFIATLPPEVAAQVRRLHDNGSSGRWLMLYFVPVGGFLVLYMLVESSEAENQYGPPVRGR
jgi:uncharacterized membrane protein YhaH (DUF805 family)